MIKYLEVISQGCTEITKEGHKIQESNSQIIYSSMKQIAAVKQQLFLKNLSTFFQDWLVI